MTGIVGDVRSDRLERVAAWVRAHPWRALEWTLVCIAVLASFFGSMEIEHIAVAAAAVCIGVRLVASGWLLRDPHEYKRGIAEIAAGAILVTLGVKPELLCSALRFVTGVFSDGLYFALVESIDQMVTFALALPPRLDS